MKLSDYKGEKGMEIAGKVMIPMFEMFANKDVYAAFQKGLAPMISTALIKTPGAVKEMLAIINDTPVEEFEIDGGKALVGVFEMLDDPALQRLFGLQG